MLLKAGCIGCSGCLHAFGPCSVLFPSFHKDFDLQYRWIDNPIAFNNFDSFNLTIKDNGIGLFSGFRETTSEL